MTDPTPQTTPTRDEADEVERIKKWLLERNRDHLAAMHERTHIMSRKDGDAEMFLDAAILLSKLASAPAPASGGVDAVAWRTVSDFVDEMLRDWAGGDDCRMGFGLNGATVTKGQFRAVQAALASLSPAATPVSEAEPGEGMVEMAEIARIVSEWRHGPMLSAEALRQIAALAKPASSPAGGDVREADIEAACRRAWLTVRGEPVGGGDGQTFCVPTLSPDVMLAIVRAALSQSTGGRAGE